MEQEKREGSESPLFDMLEERKKAGLPEAAMQDTGIYQMSGVFVGRIDAIDRNGKIVPVMAEDPPPELKGFQRVEWIILQEVAFNPLTVAELFISVLLLVWGLWLALPFSSWAAAGTLYNPIVHLFSGWESNSTGAILNRFWEAHAEEVTGAWFTVVSLLHLRNIYGRRRGDRWRQMTICVIVSVYVSLWFLLTFSDYRSATTATFLLIIVWLVACWRNVFRKAVLR